MPTNCIYAIGPVCHDVGRWEGCPTRVWNWNQSRRVPKQLKLQSDASGTDRNIYIMRTKFLSLFMRVLRPRHRDTYSRLILVVDRLCLTTMLPILFFTSRSRRRCRCERQEAAAAGQEASSVTWAEASANLEEAMKTLAGVLREKAKAMEAEKANKAVENASPPPAS